MKADLVLDALEQAVHARSDTQGLIYHSDRGSQYLCIRYSERLAECGIQASVGTTGDSYDNALAESIIGLFKAEVIWRQGPWRSIEAVEYAVLQWVLFRFVLAELPPTLECAAELQKSAGKAFVARVDQTCLSCDVLS